LLSQSRLIGYAKQYIISKFVANISSVISFYGIGLLRKTNMKLKAWKGKTVMKTSKRDHLTHVGFHRKINECKPDTHIKSPTHNRWVDKSLVIMMCQE
jgi:hypothetical protein